MSKNAHLACSEAFDVQLKNGRPSNLLTIRFDASPRPEKGVCHLQGLARISVTVDALPFGQNWFRSVIRVRRIGVLTDLATRNDPPSSPLPFFLLAPTQNSKAWRRALVVAIPKPVIPNRGSAEPWGSADHHQGFREKL